ncbi:MAG: hypothetical protein Q8R01_11115 [Ramlibacter sp.]|jgi:uncharacterized protein (UPF0332 family)|nr:hypothetical protein [Ramlibacter sp.]
MSIRLQDLFQWAKGQHSTETGRRAAVSRAYYAGYHKCIEWEQTLPQTGNPLGQNGSTHGGSHQKLINRLQQPSPNCSAAQQVLSEQLGNLLEAVRALRHRADYDLTATITLANVAQAISDVQMILVKAVRTP